MEILAELERTRVATLKYYGLGVGDLEKTYGAGKWSVRYILNHLADSETVFLYRIKQVISEPGKVVWAYDQDAWADELDYSQVPLDLAKNLYESSRAGVAYWAGLYYARADVIPFIHSETGRRTLKDELEKVVCHNDHHVADIERALRGVA
jgi:uncharacterized damage-inducible protein DinB